MRWLTRNEVELSEAQAVRILRWAILEHTDAMLSPRPFRWEDLAPAQALEVAQQPNPHLDRMTLRLRHTFGRQPALV